MFASFYLAGKICGGRPPKYEDDGGKAPKYRDGIDKEELRDGIISLLKPEKKPKRTYGSQSRYSYALSNDENIIQDVSTENNDKHITLGLRKISEINLWAIVVLFVVVNCVLYVWYDYKKKYKNTKEQKENSLSDVVDE